MPAVVIIPVEVSDEFLGDIITTAIEGGIGYWSQVSQYQYMFGENLYSTCGGKRSGEGTRATIHQLREDESGYRDEPLELTREVVAKGIERLAGPDFNISATVRGSILTAVAERDAGQIDAADADAIIQAGLLGELVYG